MKTCKSQRIIRKPNLKDEYIAYTSQEAINVTHLMAHFEEIRYHGTSMKYIHPENYHTGTYVINSPKVPVVD